MGSWSVIPYAVESIVVTLQISLPVYVIAARGIALVGVRARIAIDIRLVVLAPAAIILAGHPAIVVPVLEIRVVDLPFNPSADGLSPIGSTIAPLPFISSIFSLDPLTFSFDLSPALGTRIHSGKE